MTGDARRVSSTEMRWGTATVDSAVAAWIEEARIWNSNLRRSCHGLGSWLKNAAASSPCGSKFHFAAVTLNINEVIVVGMKAPNSAYSSSAASDKKTDRQMIESLSLG